MQHLTMQRFLQATQEDVHMPTENAWIELFDGSQESFDTHWKGYALEGTPDVGWTVADGTLHVTGGGGDIITREHFANFRT